MSGGRGLAAAAALGTLVLAALFLAGVDAAGGPFTDARPEGATRVLLGAWLPLLPFAAVLLVLARALAGRLSAGAAVAGLTAASCCLGFALHATSERGLFRVPDGVYSGFDSSYYADTVRFDGPLEVVPRWHETKPELSPRSQTHPPGPVLLYATTNALARALSGAGPSDLATFRLQGLLPGILLPVLAALWLPALFVLTRRVAGERAALVAVGVGALVPAPLLLGPGTDALAPLLGAAPLALALRGRDERSALSTVLAGLLLAAALLLGFHHLTSGLPWLLLVLLTADSRAEAGRGVLHLAGTGLVAAAALLALRAVGYDVVRDFRASLGYHAGGVTSLRSYAAYLFWSPYAFLLWTSWPVALAFGVAAARGARPGADRACRAGLAGLLAIAALDLSGLSRGETERLWLHLLPFVVLPAGALLARADVAPVARRLWLGAVFASTLVYKAVLVVESHKV